MSEGWDFVTGAEDPNRVNSADGRRRRGEANKIIYNSIGDDRQEEMRAMMKAYDIQGMWEGMKKFYNDLFKLQHSSLGMKLKKRAVPVGKSTCEACLAGKMREILSKKTTKREKIPGRGLHLDTTGRISTSIRGYNYYLLALDDATHYT